MLLFSYGKVNKYFFKSLNYCFHNIVISHENKWDEWRKNKVDEESNNHSDVINFNRYNLEVFIWDIRCMAHCL